MPAYRLRVKPSVENDLRRLPPASAERVLERIEALADDPLPRQSVKLHGADSLYRLRVGVYRVVYQVDADALTVTVQLVRHRKEAYR